MSSRDHQPEQRRAGRPVAALFMTLFPLVFLALGGLMVLSYLRDAGPVNGNVVATEVGGGGRAAGPDGSQKWARARARQGRHRRQSSARPTVTGPESGSQPLPAVPGYRYVDPPAVVRNPMAELVDDLSGTTGAKMHLIVVEDSHDRLAAMGFVVTYPRDADGGSGLRQQVRLQLHRRATGSVTELRAGGTLAFVAPVQRGMTAVGWARGSDQVLLLGEDAEVVTDLARSILRA